MSVKLINQAYGSDSHLSQPLPQRMKPLVIIEQHSRWLKPLSTLLNKPIIPCATTYQALGHGLWQGDPPMDQLVDWLFAAQPAQRKQQFEQVLHQGIDSVQPCPDALRDFFEQIEQPPAWVDLKKLDKAVEFIAASGIHANYILRDMALMGGYLLSGLNQSLVLTGALNKSAAQRLAETSKWWIDCTSKDGLARQNAGFKLTIQVRLIHALVRRNLKKRPEWQANLWGLPINQIDLAATNLAFCSLFLIGLRAIGIFPTRQEAQAVMHFWKYLGWLMGINERWLVDTELDGGILLYQLVQTQPAADWTSQALGQALSKEPFEKHHKYFTNWQQQLDYYKHLSISRYFLGAKNMQLLGLPKTILPWFPLLITPKNLLTFRLQRHIPWLRQQQVKRGRQAQLNYQAQFGKKGQQVIKPAKNHPAYIAD